MADKSEKLAKILQKAQEDAPEDFKALMDYLTLAERVPEIAVDQNLYPSNGEYDTWNNKIALDYAGGTTSTLMHELTHAAQNSISLQSSRKNMRGTTVGTRDPDRALESAMRKMWNNPKEIISALLGRETISVDPSYNSYRTQTNESQAFGVGNMARKEPRTYETNSGHLDATRAQEFMVLLDLAHRRLQANRDKEKENK